MSRHVTVEILERDVVLGRCRNNLLAHIYRTTGDPSGRYDRERPA